MKNLQAEKLLEMDRVKSRFFANISHEFRTPLTLILGPLQKLLNSTGEETTRKELNIMQRSARRLAGLIEQLLDLSRLETGHMKLKARNMNIVYALKPMILSFASLAEKRKIKLTYSPPQHPIMGWIDVEILEKIVTNLLSNAFKFTPDGGKIEVRISPTSLSNPPLTKGGEKEGVEISVSDTGPGIPPDQLDKIFDRFYQLDDSGTHHHEGTGIGLALTRELVERHYGEISVESKVNKGSTFTIRFPLGRDHLKADEIVEETEKSEEQKISEEMVSEKTDDTQQIETIQSAVQNKRLPLLLIVEDHADMRQYMRGYLENHYRIIETVNGVEGMNQSKKYMPDLVISDVMMPEMDGFALCQKLKTDPQTSHIPVILLTARADAESKLSGLETGADDYITKPFDARELQIRVKNLIEQRNKLKETFVSNALIDTVSLAQTKTDKNFLKKIIKIVQLNMNNPQFNVEVFISEMAISRSQLHRKIKGLVGLSTTAFIRLLRLKQAAIMLKNKAYSISEIAYKVGFNNINYFNKCFRRQFNTSPSEFRESHQN
jgi:DNA-binding response OmpR family regulator/nitrogen-specific signal transduction histidine kinase